MWVCLDGGARALKKAMLKRLKESADEAVENFKKSEAFDMEVALACWSPSW